MDDNEDPGGLVDGGWEFMGTEKQSTTRRTVGPHYLQVTAFVSHFIWQAAQLPLSDPK